MEINELTPVEYVNGIYLKREDKFVINNVCGGKARACCQLIQDGINKGYKDFVTAGSRMSPQCELVSCLCEYFNVKCHLFMPKGKDTSIINNINKNKLSTIYRTKVGYNSVICKWSKDFAEEHNYYYIPFGMECEENISITRNQVLNIPNNIKRIVMPVGSGMSFISVLNGLTYYNKENIEVIGISVGKDITKTLEKYINTKNKYTIIKSNLNYEQSAKDYLIGEVELDKIYEAKCLPYLQNGDLLWIVGKRRDN